MLPIVLAVGRRARARLRGACGELVVDTVFAGHGSRKLVATAAQAGVNVGVVSAAPKID